MKKTILTNVSTAFLFLFLVLAIILVSVINDKNAVDALADCSVMCRIEAMSYYMIQGSVENSIQSHPEGTLVTVKAIPKEGYLFEGWYEGSETNFNRVDGADATYSFVATGDRFLTAFFTADPSPNFMKMMPLTWKDLVRKDEVFYITPSLFQMAPGNIGKLTVRFNSAKFEYKGFERAHYPGVPGPDSPEIIFEQIENGEIKMIFHLDHYRLNAFGSLLFAAKENIDLSQSEDAISVDAVYIWKDNKGKKSIRTVSQSTIAQNWPTEPDEAWNADVIGVSDLFDRLGVSAKSIDWGSVFVPTVNVAPLTVNLLKGGIQQFGAAVSGIINRSGSVQWSITSPHHVDTIIDCDGLLTVSINEPEIMLVIRATSTADSSNFSESMVTIVDHHPELRWGVFCDTSCIFDSAERAPSNPDNQALRNDLSVAIKNIGNQSTGMIEVSMTTGSLFTVVPQHIPDIEVAGRSIVTITADVSMPEGTYLDIVTISGTHVATQHFLLTIVVKPNEQTTEVRYLVTLNQKKGGIAVVDKSDAVSGDAVTVGVSFDEYQFRFDGWRIVPTVTWAGGSTNSRNATFIMPSENVTIEPIFSAESSAHNMGPNEGNNSGGGGGGSITPTTPEMLKNLGKEVKHIDRNQYDTVESTSVMLPEQEVKQNRLKSRPPLAEIKSFTDINPSDWCYEDVAFAIENGLFFGTSSTTFEPDNPMTRAMLVTVLWRIAGLQDAAMNNEFVDVPDYAYYAKAVFWGLSANVVVGYGDRLFGSDDGVTREQLMVFLYRYAGLPKSTDEKQEFTDAEVISEWAVEAIIWAVKADLLRGNPNGFLKPSMVATRAEVAAVLHRYCGMGTA